MQIRRTVWDMVKVNAAAAVALACMLVCLTGLVQVCACDADPDDCGQACHMCVDAPPAPRAPCSARPGGLPPPCGSLFAPCGHEGAPCGERLAERCGTEACRHVALTLGDVWAPAASVALPAVAVADPVLTAGAARVPHPLRLRPVSTAPPDAGGRYLASSTRLHPRS